MWVVQHSLWAEGGELLTPRSSATSCNPPRSPLATRIMVFMS